MVSSAFLWGFLIDTLGRQKLLFYGLLLSGIMEFSSGLAQKFWVLVVLKFFSGIMWVFFYGGFFYYKYYYTRKCDKKTQKIIFDFLFIDISLFFSFYFELHLFVYSILHLLMTYYCLYHPYFLAYLLSYIFLRLNVTKRT